MNIRGTFDGLLARPVLKEEVSLWNRYMADYHYPGLKWSGGKSLRYVATEGGKWAALLGWSSASKNCGSRDRYIGWSGEKKYKRLRYLLNNTRFLMLPWVKQKNLASKGCPNESIISGIVDVYDQMLF
jgi:hypothetical protein